MTVPFFPGRKIGHSLISRETSFVAVERRETPVSGDMKLRKVPVALTTGWGGMGRQIFARGRVMPTTVDASLAMLSAAPPAASMLSQPQASQARGSGPVERTSGGSYPPPWMSRRNPYAGRADLLVILQTAEGFWNLEKALAVLIDRDLDELRVAIKNVVGPKELVARAWATALALAWLELNASDMQDDWLMLAEKARRWLDAMTVKPPDSLDWLRAAHRFITR